MRLTGEFYCKVFQSGELVKEFSGKNLVVDSGKRRVTESLFSGGPINIDQIAFGEGDTAPDPTDIFLTGAVFMKPITTKEPVTPTSVKFNWFLGNSEGNGRTIKEFGLMIGGELFARKTGLTVAKNNTITITGEWVITIN